MTAILCCAYLRVFQPLEAFEDDERAEVERIAKDPSSVRANRPLDTPGLIAREESLETFVTVVDGQPYACPARTRLRTLLSMIAFDRMLPQGVGPVFFSEREIRDARRELEALQAAHPGLQPSMLQSAWHAPLQWFACFDDTERRIEAEGDHPRIRYRTRVGRAHERLASALDMLKGGVVHPVYIGVMFELQEWLAAFHPDGILELDYASVSTMFDPDELADDHSAADVWAAIQALAEGDGMKAGLSYRRANERWLKARRREAQN